MKLADWLQENGMSAPEFAEKVEVDRSLVTKWLNGKVRPGWTDVLPRVIAATNGQVTANDFLPEGAMPAEVNDARTPIVS